MLVALAACGPSPAPPTARLAATLDTLLAHRLPPGAVVAVAVRDAGVRYDRLADRPFHAASTMKVPVMIEAFRQAHRGRLSLDDRLVVRNAFRSIVDGSAYRIEDDADDALYARTGQPVPLRELVYQMITVSSNLATNLLIEHLTADSVQATCRRLGAPAMQVLRGVEDLKAFRQGLNNRTTAAALATLLEALLEGRAVSPEADRAMIGILRDQRFNTMIPAGLPAGVRVAHKTGWITGIHHDAAIVEPPDAPPYVLVILTEGFPDEAASAALGAAVARAVHAVLRGG